MEGVLFYAQNNFQDKKNYSKYHPQKQLTGQRSNGKFISILQTDLSYLK